MHAVFRQARIPVLVTPSGVGELASIEANRPAFSCGRVLVLIDPAEDGVELLETAALLRSAASEPLLVVAVDHRGGAPVDEGELRARVETLQMPEDTRVDVVRAGSLAEGVRGVIERERIGMMVIGMRPGTRRIVSGSIVYEALKQNQALVLGVPLTRSSIRLSGTSHSAATNT